MGLFRRRETLNEKLLREAGYSTGAEPAGDESLESNREDDDGEIVFTLDARDLTGTSYELVTLPDSSVLMDEDAPDGSDLAEAVEQDLDPPYRASPDLQDDGYWLVTAAPDPGRAPQSRRRRARACVGRRHDDVHHRRRGRRPVANPVARRRNRRTARRRLRGSPNAARRRPLGNPGDRSSA